MYTNNQLMFPHHVIPLLRDLRGPAWRELGDQVLSVPEGDVQSLALMLMMVRLNGCMAWDTGSYRAMRGCDACAIHTLRRYTGSAGQRQGADEQARNKVRPYL